MNSKEKKSVVTQEDIMKILDSCYDKCLNGIPKVSSKVEKMANDYLEKYMPKAHVINICDKYCADENHKWGLAPMHYCDKYYIDMLSRIKEYYN